MAVKRKRRKSQHNPIARMKPRGSTDAPLQRAANLPEELPEELFDRADLSDRSAVIVMSVIAAACLIYIGFIAWCVSQMPAK